VADDGFVNVMNDPSWRSEGRFFGKYRGIVTENKDPKALGRIQAEVPAVSGMKKNWANPCTPYAGKDVGFYTIPPVGAKVWIEFEGGNPNFPIWSGCFWQDGEVPTEVGNNQDDPSQVKVWKTRVMTMWIDDTDQKGQVVLQFNDPSVSEPVTVKFLLDSNGLAITVQGSEDTSKITQKPDLIDTNSKTLSTTSTENTTFTAQKNLTATVTEDATVEASGNAKVTASKSLTAQGQSATVKADQSLSLQGGTTATLEGSTSVTVKGMSATFQADGNASIKGAMVNIN
jgi:uncharacterized protein involved in type VI secretion and phage assembly